MSTTSPLPAPLHDPSADPMRDPAAPLFSEWPQVQKADDALPTSDEALTDAERSAALESNAASVARSTASAV